MNGNKTTATSSEERRMQRGISVLAFFVPAFIMLVLFIIRGIYPFGDRSFLFSDMYHQYMPFLSEFVHKIKAGEGLFYSYNVGIGSNFLALYVYYLASPFNWLVFLLPEGLIMEFMSYLVILRIGLMGLTSASICGKCSARRIRRLFCFPLRMLCPAIWRPTTGM